MKPFITIKLPINLKASMTIESSIIYPLMIFISILLIMHAFYMHDRLVISADTYRILMEDNADRDDTTALSYPASDIIDRLNEKCILSHSFSISFDDSDNTVKLIDNNDHIANISFTNYERCDFVRQYYTLLTLIRKDD